MIDRASITQWAGRVPWNDPAQVEQDLIISRALVAILGPSKRSVQRGIGEKAER